MGKYWENGFRKLSDLPNLGENWDIASSTKSGIFSSRKGQSYCFENRSGKSKTNSNFPLSYVFGHYFPNLGFETAANRLQLFDMKLLVQGY